MAEQTPAERAVELIAEAMPGFKAELHAETDTIRVRGPVFFAGRADIAMLYGVRYPVPSEGPDYRPVEAFARQMVDVTRQHAIAQLGLKEVIAECERRAFERGRAEGYREGHRVGKVEGRRSYLQDLAELIAAHEIELPDE